MKELSMYIRSIFFSLLIFAILPSSADGSGSAGFVHRSVQWQARGGQEITGLHCTMLDSNCCYSTRILFVVPSQGPVMLTSHLDVRAGTIRHTILDVAENWWLEILDRHETKASDVHGFMQFVLQGYEKSNRKFFERKISSSGSLDAKIEIDYVLGGWEEQMLEQVATTGALDALHDASASVLNAAWIIQSSLEREVDLDRRFSAEFGSLLILLRTFQEHGQTATSKPTRNSDLKLDSEWSLGEMGPLTRGRYVSEPNLLELMSHFPNLENVDPFQGLEGRGDGEPLRQ